MNPIAIQIPEAVKISGLGRSTIYEAIKSGRLPIRKAGRRTLILADDLRSFVVSLPSGSSTRAAA